MKLAAISPRTSDLMINTGASSPEAQQFEQLFSEKAHAVLGAKSPDLANAIVHFKTLESNLEANTASGVFVCDLGGAEIHIPILLAGGKVKTPEMFFDPSSGIFMPLTAKFIKRVQETISQEMGAIDPSAKLSDMGTPDIGGITSPPTTSGKFASFNLPLLMSRLPNKSKKAFREFIKKSSVVLKSGVKYHGSDFVNSLVDSQEKVAHESTRVSPYRILTAESPAAEFKEVFKDRSKLAFREALTSGYVAADFRKNAAELVTTEESPVKVTSPTTNGTYKLLKRDGKYVKSLVIKSPITLGDRVAYKYLCLLENGDYLLTDKITAVETSEEVGQGSELAKRLASKPSLRAGTCTFIKSEDGLVLGATSPESVSNVSSSSSGRVTAKLEDQGLTAVMLAPNGSAAKPYVPTGESTAFIPASYSPLYLRNRVSDSDFVTEPDSVRKLVSEGVAKLASTSIKVLKNNLGLYVVNGQNVGSEAGFVEKVASLGGSVKSASQFASSLVPGSSVKAHLVRRSDLLKLASIFGASPAAPSVPPEAYAGGMAAPMPPGMGAAPAPMPMDPSQQMAMDPSQQMAMDPSQGMGIPVEQQMVMEQAAQLQDQNILDASIASVLLEEAGLGELTTEYLPSLVDALDSLGRILLTVQMKDYELSEQVGPDEYTRLQKSLLKVFSGLGDIVLRLEEARKIPQEGADLYGYQA